MKRLRWTVVLIAATVLLAGCGEISNTLTAPAGTADTLTVALDATPNFTQVGIFEAQALGYFRQTDLDVHFIVAKDPLAAIQNGQAQVALSDEPAVLLKRNTHISVAAVAAILQTPTQVKIVCANPGGPIQRAGSGAAATATGTSTSAAASTTTSTPRSHAPLHPQICRAKTVAEPNATYAKAPTYNGLNLVVTEDEIVNNAPILRRFVQAVGRGYTAAKANPASATRNLVKLHPSLDYQVQLVGVKASMPNFFPTVQPGETTAKEWGWETVMDWNRFGAYLFRKKLITNVNATPDADTNELLAGQGV